MTITSEAKQRKETKHARMAKLVHNLTKQTPVVDLLAYLNDLPVSQWE